MDFLAQICTACKGITSVTSLVPQRVYVYRLLDQKYSKIIYILNYYQLK